MVPWAMAHNRSPSGRGSNSSQRVTISRWPELMTDARASRRSPMTGTSTLMVYPAVSTPGPATAPAAKVRALSAA